MGEKIRTYGTVAMNRFNLLNLFSSKMRAKELHEAYIYMTASSNYWSDNYRYGAEVHFEIPNEMHLGGTPLNSALFVSFSVMREFIKKNQVDVINSIFLTDGDSHSCNSYWKAPETDESGYTTNTGRFDYRDENVILRDPVSKKQMQIGDGSMTHRYRRGGMTSTLVKFLREVFDINIVNFFLIPKMRRWDMMNHIEEMKSAGGDDSLTFDEDADTCLRKFRKDKYLIAPEAKVSMSNI